MNTINTAKRQSKSKGSADFFETQPETVDYVYRFLTKKSLLQDRDIVADFSCGRCAISNRIHQLNPSISFFNSDIYARTDREDVEIGDMFFIEALDSYQAIQNNPSHIIMNPPFNKLDKVLEYYLPLLSTIESLKSISILHRLAGLEGMRRAKITKQHEAQYILNMVKRQSFFVEKNKKLWSPPFSCVWRVFTKEKPTHSILINLGDYNG